MYPMGMSAFILSSVQFVLVLDLCECIFSCVKGTSQTSALVGQLS